MNPEIPLPAFSVASKNNKPNFKTKYVYTGDKQSSLVTAVRLGPHWRHDD